MEKPSQTDFEVRRIPGQLPEFWDRQVVFIANLLSLFYGNRAETHALRERVGTVETYGNRLVPILSLLFGRHPNLLILERAPDPDLSRYFVDRLGLVIPELAVLAHDDYLALASPTDEPPADQRTWVERVAAHNAPWIDGYITDEVLVHLAELTGKKTINAQQGSALGNNKLLLHRHLESQNLLVFDTHMAHSADAIRGCLDALRKQGYSRAAVKAQIGASGIGLVRLHVDDKPSVPDYMFHEGPCMVQGWLDEQVEGVRRIGSPSVQLFVGENHLSLFDITEQILSDESIHQGNVAPPPSFAHDSAIARELLRQAEIAGRWLANQGYRGTGSVDFHLLERNGETEVRVCEINARVTGATYPAVLARHFKCGAWLMRNLLFESPQSGRELLESLDRSETLFLPERVRGLLPINFNLDPEGQTVKGQFLYLGDTSEEVQTLLNHTADVLPVKWNFDRD